MFRGGDSGPPSEVAVTSPFPAMQDPTGWKAGATLLRADSRFSFFTQDRFTPTGCVMHQRLCCLGA
jgi:hypothetical protein